jgi:hypothetical protein
MTAQSLVSEPGIQYDPQKPAAVIMHQQSYRITKVEGQWRLKSLPGVIKAVIAELRDAASRISRFVPASFTMLPVPQAPLPPLSSCL